MVSDEDVCLRCGKCCHELRQVGRIWIRTKERCQYLKDDNTCSCYNERNGKLLKPNGSSYCNGSVKDNILVKRCQPESCPYVKYFGVKNYKSVVSDILWRKRR